MANTNIGFRFGAGGAWAVCALLYVLGFIAAGVGEVTGNVGAGVVAFVFVVMGIIMTFVLLYQRSQGV